MSLWYALGNPLNFVSSHFEINRYYACFNSDGIFVIKQNFSP